MNAEKWLIGVVATVSLIGTGMMSWEIGRKAAEKEEQRHQRAMRAGRPEQPAVASRVYAPKQDKVPSLSNGEVKRYYFCHIYDFEPLPHNPIERAKVWQGIEAQIREKLSTTAAQTAQQTAPSSGQES